MPTLSCLASNIYRRFLTASLPSVVVFDAASMQMFNTIYMRNEKKALLSNTRFATISKNENREVFYIIFKKNTYAVKNINFQKSPRSGLCRFSDMRQQLLNFTFSRRERRTQKPTSDILTWTDLTIGNILLKI